MLEKVLDVNNLAPPVPEAEAGYISEHFELQRNRSLWTLLFQSLAISAVSAVYVEKSASAQVLSC